MADTVKKLMRYIEVNIFEDLTLKNIETSFNYSERHLRRVFKENADLSIHPYITDRKMAYALFDLQTSAEHVKDLYLKYGYKSHDSFSRAFKRTFNVSPKNFDKISELFELKHIMPNALTPFVVRPNQDSIFKGLVSLDNQKRLATYILSVDSFGFNEISNIIQNGFSTHYLNNYASSKHYQIDTNQYINSFLNNKNVKRLDKNLVFILAKEKTPLVNDLVVAIEKENELCMVITEDSINDFESLMFHLQLLFNKTASIKFSTIISFFKPYHTFIKNLNFKNLEAIKAYNFSNELSNFSDVLLLITVNKEASVDVFSDIVKHINKSGVLKVNISVAYNESQTDDFNLLLIAK